MARTSSGRSRSAQSRTWKGVDSKSSARVSSTSRSSSRIGNSTTARRSLRNGGIFWICWYLARKRTHTDSYARVKRSSISTSCISLNTDASPGPQNELDVSRPTTLSSGAAPVLRATSSAPPTNRAMRVILSRYASALGRLRVVISRRARATADFSRLCQRAASFRARHASNSVR